jgi:hypothetical protein
MGYYRNTPPSSWSMKICNAQLAKELMKHVSPQGFSKDVRELMTGKDVTSRNDLSRSFSCTR